MEFKRVVITGMGAITPIGNSVDELWNNLINGVSGAAPTTRFDVTNHKTKFACELKGFNALDHFDRKETRKYDVYTQYAMVAARQAIIDSNVDLDTLDKDRAGVVWGAGIGGLQTFQDEVSIYDFEKPRLTPFFIPKMIANMAGGCISIEFGLRGPNLATVTACASSANAIIDAVQMIQLGKANLFVTGGSEATVNEAGVAGFNALRALSTRNDDPTAASRPFDKDRDGFVMGEGGAALIVEEYEHAVARGAKIYAEIVGSGMSADAHHMTAPDPDGAGAALCMKSAVENAGLQPSDIDHVNTHGTSTPLGDVAEPKAIKQVFGEHAYNLSINSTKSMTGHLLGAAGAVEAIASVKALQEGIIPPTINFNELDPNIDPKLDFTFNVAKKRDIKYALSNTFGFGGHNASLIFKKIQ